MPDHIEEAAPEQRKGDETQTWVIVISCCLAMLLLALGE